jgi:hypothetical protein
VQTFKYTSADLWDSFSYQCHVTTNRKKVRFCIMFWFSHSKWDYEKPNLSLSSAKSSSQPGKTREGLETASQLHLLPKLKLSSAIVISLAVSSMNPIIPVQPHLGDLENKSRKFNCARFNTGKSNHMPKCLPYLSPSRRMYKLHWSHHTRGPWTQSSAYGYYHHPNHSSR